MTRRKTTLSPAVVLLCIAGCVSKELKPSETDATQTIETTDATDPSSFERGKKHKTSFAVDAGLAWLRRHQDAAGRWDCDGFMKHDTGDPNKAGPGNPVQDIGITGLALLAFLSDGSTTTSGPTRTLLRGP